MAVNPNSFVVRTPPTFDDPGTERRHRLERLAGAARLFARFGFSEGLLGHMTVRDPEHHDQFWATPMGVSFRKLRVSDLVRVDHRGELLEGRHPVNPVGLLLHSAVHRARPEVVAVCHAHSQHGKAFSSLGKLLDPITQDACVFFEQTALIREPRVALDAASADRFAAAFGSMRCAIQVGHGLFTTGESIDEAAWAFISMDRACQVQLLADAAGTPEHWPAEGARALARTFGSAALGWLAFQTLWDEIVDSDPDLFD